MTLRPSRRLCAGVAAILYAVAGGALALTPNAVEPDALAGRDPSSCPPWASPEGVVVAAANRLGLTEAMAAQIASLRYGPGAEGRLADAVSGVNLSGLTSPPPPFKAPCDRT
ncbi:MAG TPA: hypothetical protein VFW47_09550 [Phenylobacterium sp.]|nr:hypothetical protein [Phenylobacterium sp.]